MRNRIVNPKEESNLDQNDLLSTHESNTPQTANIKLLRRGVREQQSIAKSMP